jgi:phosphatidylinositol alpha-mannosyltransferase
VIEVPEAAERLAAPGATKAPPDSRPSLKIGIVSPYGFPHPGGVNEHVRHTYEELRSLGHDPWIITPRYGRERDSEGHVLRVGTGWAVPSNGSVGRLTVGLRLRPRVRDLLTAHRFDVLHYHEPFVPFLGPAVLTESRTVNIATFHAFGGFSPSYWLGRHAAAGLADRLHGRIAVSGAARHFIERYFPGSYEIIPNGVEIEPFATAQPYEELRDGTLNILFVGRLEDRKGLSDLLRGYHRLRKRHVDARLIVVGNGPRLREYRRYVATRRIRDVEFVGHVPLEAKLRYFASADIFCAPSTGQESFGIVLLEAMAAGLPIVASDIHGYKNVVSRNVEGYLVEPRNPRAIAAALYKLAGDPDLRHRMGDAGRAKASDYSWERVTQQVVAFYHATRERVAA